MSLFIRMRLYEVNAQFVSLDKNNAQFVSLDKNNAQFVSLDNNNAQFVSLDNNNAQFEISLFICVVYSKYFSYVID